MTNWEKVSYSRVTNSEIFPSNKKINILNDVIRKTRKDFEEKMKKLQADKDEIQNACDHEYHFTSSGPYDDYYECKFCGHETEV
jgi:hypothetical protein